jgi:hypothetical protein
MSHWLNFFKSTRFVQLFCMGVKLYVTLRVLIKKTNTLGQFFISYNITVLVWFAFLLVSKSLYVDMIFVSKGF